MSFVVYVETNFLMSVAMGREQNGGELLAAISQDFRVFMPSNCYSEAFSAINREKNLINEFGGGFEKYSNYLKRNISSSKSSGLRSAIEQIRVENDGYLNEIQAKLFEFIDGAADRIELLEMTSAVIRSSIKNVVIPKPNDNLILHSILDDAMQRSADTKVLLTENTSDFSKLDVRNAFREVGIPRPLTRASDVLEKWKKSMQS